MASWWFFIQPSVLTKQLDYVGGSAPIYVGEANPGTSSAFAGWRIQKLTYDGSGNVTNVQWSPNFSNFGDVWNLRAGYTYS